MSFTHRAKERAYAADPEAFKSYSGATREVKRALDQRRTKALADAARHYGEPENGQTPPDENDHLERSEGELQAMRENGVRW